MSTPTELVSILIPTFNRAGVIEETIRSALAQTHAQVEVVVVDNASTDDTWDRVQAVAKADARVRAFRNERNLGPVANWLACAAAGHGRYAKILWSDDLIAPTFIERCLPGLRDEDVAFAYTPALIFSGSSPQAGGVERFRGGRRADMLMPSATFIDGLMTDGDFPASPGCALFRMDDLRRNLMLHVPNRHSSDFSMHAMGNDILLMLLTAHQRRSVSFVAETLSFFRSHTKSISVLEGAGRVHFHYDLAKAWFCSEVARDIGMERRLNALILWHLARFGPAPYGMSRISDFYPAPKKTPVAWATFVRAAARAVRDKLARMGRSA